MSRLVIMAAVMAFAAPVAIVGALNWDGIVSESEESARTRPAGKLLYFYSSS